MQGSTSKYPYADVFFRNLFILILLAISVAITIYCTYSIATLPFSLLFLILSLEFIWVLVKLKDYHNYYLYNSIKFPTCPWLWSSFTATPIQTNAEKRLKIITVSPLYVLLFLPFSLMLIFLPLLKTNLDHLEPLMVSIIGVFLFLAFAYRHIAKLLNVIFSPLIQLELDSYPIISGKSIIAKLSIFNSAIFEHNLNVTIRVCKREIELAEGRKNGFWSITKDAKTFWTSEVKVKLIDRQENCNRYEINMDIPELDPTNYSYGSCLYENHAGTCWILNVRSKKRFYNFSYDFDLPVAPTYYRSK